MDEKDTLKDEVNKTFSAQQGCQILIAPQKEKENVIVCDVCGHVNPEHTAICKMCSNYLD